MAAMAALAMAPAASATKLALSRSLSPLTARRPGALAPAPALRLCKFSPRASVSGGAAPSSSWSPERDVASSPMASQAAPTSMRSAEADVMGLMLRQRIVFLGHEMNDFVADAIVSQLLLLDAVDPKKEIRLFVNCPGGSIRYCPDCGSPAFD
jgi:ATP-dependent Clp protease protease subunit